MLKLFLLVLFLAHSYAISSGDRQALLNAHNEVRRKTAKGQVACKGGNCPSGTIPDLVWDNNLANIAQKHSAKCVMQHTSNGYGENLWMMYSSRGVGISDMVKGVTNSWSYNEAKLMPKSYVNKYKFGMSYGHFSQVVWGNTRKVGCGYTKCSKGTYMTCNYDPPGNYGNQMIYKVGSGPGPGPAPAPTKKPSCSDRKKSSWCRKRKRRCKRNFVKNRCKKTCGVCSELAPLLIPEPEDPMTSIPDDLDLDGDDDDLVYPDPEEPIYMEKRQPIIPEANGISMTINMTNGQIFGIFTLILVSVTLCCVSLFGFYVIKKGDCKKKNRKYVKQVNFDSTDEESQ